jgi:FAD binding domain/Berberine and berberine like
MSPAPPPDIGAAQAIDAHPDISQTQSSRNLQDLMLSAPQVMVDNLKPSLSRHQTRRRENMTDLIGRTLDRLGSQLSGRLSLPGNDRFVAATTLWAKADGHRPRAVAHCQTTKDVQSAIRAARDCDMPLSVRGGGHDWAGRALCDGLVIDLSGMNRVEVHYENCTAGVGGGARASDVLSAIDSLSFAAVTGSVGAVGMAGLTLGGGYGPLIGRFGLALDNLVAAEVVLADGSIVTATKDQEAELLWALRGGGGNFGVVTDMHVQLHYLPTVRSGTLVYPFAEGKAVLEGCADIAMSAPDALTAQVGFLAGPDGRPVTFVVPTWCGPQEQGDARLAPFLKLGTVLANSIATTTYQASLTAFDAYIVNGQRVFMETCWLPKLGGAAIDAFIAAIEMSVSPGCAVFTHEFKGAASRIPVEATAFGLRHDHVLVEILATVDTSDISTEQRHRGWALEALQALDAMALSGGYPNLLSSRDPHRVAKSYGSNGGRLVRAKRRYDPDNVFRCAIPLPVSEDDREGTPKAWQFPTLTPVETNGPDTPTKRHR